MSDLNAATLMTKAREGCYCGQYRKPCSYHEGYGDGLDAAQSWGIAHTELQRYREALERIAENGYGREREIARQALQEHQ